MISIQEIQERHRLRSQSMSHHLQEMASLTEAYEGCVAVPLPEMDRNEKTAVANLIAQGLDQTAMRIASSLPDVNFAATVPGQDLAEKRARKSRQAVIGWWDASTLDLKLARRARWLIGYACAPATVRWDPKDEIPRWHLRSPLTTFPAMGDDPDDMVPTDVIFCYKRSRRWLAERYPSPMARLAKSENPDAKYEVMEYVDADELVLCVAGQVPPSGSQSSPSIQGMPLVELERQPNRAGVPLVAVPGRITLGRRQGAYNGMIGLYEMQAKLMALDYIGVVRSVYPEQWVVARPNETPGIVALADGMRGIPGQIKGAALETVNLQPGYQTGQTIDRLERYQRITGGVSPDLGGESQTNVRTGARGDQLLSAVIDFPVQEAQKVLARALQAEVKMSVAVAKAYGGDIAKSFYITAKGSKGTVDYVPNRDIPTDSCTVSFAHAGADENQLVVQVGQLLGTGLMSKRTGRALVPLIDDAQSEEDNIVAEGLEQALLSGIAQQVQSGALGPADVARIAASVREDKMTLEQAVLTVQKAKQVEQSSSGAPGTPSGPVPPGAPEAQPGLGGPGAPPQAGTNPIGPSPSEQGLAQLLGALKSGANNRVAPGGPAPVPAGAQ